MPSLWERLTGREQRASTPKPPASIVGPERERAAETMDLDALCRVMRPRSLAFARAYLRGGSSRAAAITAGYPASSAHKAGHRLLRDAFVRRYIALARIEAAIAERADLAALRAQLWDIANGRCQMGAPSKECRCPSCSATAKERETARTNLVRILLALERGGPGGKSGDVGSAEAPAGTSQGWTREARAAFERDVLGVELPDEPPEAG